MIKHSRFALALLACSGVTALSTGAQAQTQPTPGAAASDSESTDQEVVVTGSRVIRNGNQSPTPVTVAPTEQLLEVHPGTISDALNTLPQFGGSQTSTAGPGSGVRNGAAAFITLRNAGDNHTLVLYDGHRLLPAEGQASHSSDVDLNVIPQLLLSRTDIVTGGAGAVYGSDAISGVVNLITDTDFTGVRFNASTGVSDRSDDPIQEFAIAWGQNILGDRGHIEFSYEDRDDAGILDWRDKFSRDFFAGIYGGAGAGTTASPWVVFPNQRLTNTSFGGRTSNASAGLAALNNLNFTTDGVLTPFVTATDGAYYRNSSIKASLDLEKYFGRFDYDFSNELHGYIQYGQTHLLTSNFFQPANVAFNVRLANPFLDTATAPSIPTFQAIRTANPNGTFRMTEFFATQEENTGPITTEEDYHMLLGGVDGRIGEYDWNIHFGHSWSDMSITNNSNIDVGRLLAAVDTVRDGTGTIVCRAAQTNPTYAGCVPYNPFGPTAANQAAIAYITHPSVGMTEMSLDEVQASITGSPLNTWAGPIDVALSTEWHQTQYALDSTTFPTDTVDCNGMFFATFAGNAVAGNCNGPGTTNPTIRWSGNVLGQLPHAEISVFETAFEAQIPILRDLPFVESFDLNTAVRYTDYSSTGVAWTWKIGANWQVTDDFRLRATRSRDIRAPNLFELYAPPQVSIQGTFVDLPAPYGSGLTGSVPLVQNSDPNIQPEVANTTTAGFVWEPQAVPGLSVALDAWRIEMENTIFQVRAIDQFVRDACVNSGGTSDYCDFYVRPAPGAFPTQLIAQNLNIASQDTYGADLEINYSTEVLGGRALDLRAFVAWQPHNIFDTGTGTVLDIAGAFNNRPANVAQSPSVRASLMAQLHVTDSLRFAVLERWRSGFDCESDTTGVVHVCDPSHNPSIAYTNFTATYAFEAYGSDIEVFGNVQNLFDEFPDPMPMQTLTTPSRGINPMAIGDDPVGRYFIVGLRMRM